MGPIPPSAMYSYADRFSLIGSFEEFMQVICSMDDVYLKYHSDERKKEQQRAIKKPNPNRR